MPEVDGWGKYDCIFCEIGEISLDGIMFGVGNPFFIPVNALRVQLLPAQDCVVGS